MKKLISFSLAAVFTTLLTMPVRAVDNDEPLVPKLTEQAPEIDGDLDDEVWESALKLTGFKTYRPDFGQEMEYETEVYLSYDAENLYFAFKCYDNPNHRQPDCGGKDLGKDR